MHPAQFFKLVRLNGARGGFVPEIVQANHVNQRDSGSLLISHVSLQSHVWDLGFFLRRASNLFRGNNANRPGRRASGVDTGEGGGGVGEEFRVVSSD
jgi:hypothetical protein